MRSARRWLLIGDHAQLSPFALEAFKTELKALIEEVNLMGTVPIHPGSDGSFDIAWDFFTFLFEGNGLGVGEPAKPVDILETQWRMHPEIGDLMTDVYYPKMRNGFRRETGYDDASIRKIFRHEFSDPPELNGKTGGRYPHASCETDVQYSWLTGEVTSNHFDICRDTALVKRLQVGTRPQRTVFLSPYRPSVC